MVGSYLTEGLRSLERQYAELLGNVRGRGLMCAFDGVSVTARDRIVTELYRLGVIVLRCGEKSVRFRPSLTFTRAEADELLARVADALKRVASL